MNRTQQEIDRGAWRPPERRRGRGARSNASGRYEAERRLAIDDGWSSPEEAPALRTEVTIETPRQVITRNASPDVPFDRSINPYRGCEHGCIYCYARPSHAWLGLSPGLDFETRLFARPEAPKLLERELARAGYRCRPIALGTNTDPYQPIEREWNIMRGILEVLDAASHPLTIVTKSHLVTRDIDILARMAGRRLVSVALSVTTLDARLARCMEPRASTPSRRLEAIRRLSAAGVPTGVMVAPVIPALTDHEIEAILEAAHDAGATHAAWIMLRLPLEVRDLFAEWLAEETPDRARRILNRIGAVRGGRLNDPRFGARMRGDGPFAELVARRFRLARNRLGLDARPPTLDCTRFTVTPRSSSQRDLDL
ncbi:MAG: PA0069 family radical SAM protein [Rhodothalassiaceae bacterium]